MTQNNTFTPAVIKRKCDQSKRFSNRNVGARIIDHRNVNGSTDSIIELDLDRSALFHKFNWTADEIVGIDHDGKTFFVEYQVVNPSKNITLKVSQIGGAL